MSWVICVLGDLGRSPRMLNHSRLLKELGEVHIIGYSENSIPSDIKSSKSVHVQDISSRLIQSLRSLPFILYAPLRILLESGYIAYALMKCGKTEAIIIQNPPSFPILPIAVLYGKLRGIPIVIDWHNLGFTRMVHSRRSSKIVSIVKFLEKLFGKRADLNLCVSEGMKDYLMSEWGIRSIVLRDAPSEKFINTSKLLGDVEPLLNRLEIPTQCFKIISSTSWTDDEDMEMLLEVLDILETEPYLPRKIALIISGKGPLKEQFEKFARTKSWRRCLVKCVWVAADEYPKLMAAADIGVCLHTSTSGLDLPMKVADMYGARIPALAYYYPVIEEIVPKFMTFSTAQQLADKIKEVMINPQSAPTLEGSWETQWRDIAYDPILAVRPNCIIYSDSSVWLTRIVYYNSFWNRIIEKGKQFM